MGNRESIRTTDSRPKSCTHGTSTCPPVNPVCREPAAGVALQNSRRVTNLRGWDVPCAPVARWCPLPPTDLLVPLGSIGIGVLRVIGGPHVNQIPTDNGKLGLQGVEGLWAGGLIGVCPFKPGRLFGDSGHFLHWSTVAIWDGGGGGTGLLMAGVLQNAGMAKYRSYPEPQHERWPSKIQN